MQTSNKKNYRIFWRRPEVHIDGTLVNNGYLNQAKLFWHCLFQKRGIMELFELQVKGFVIGSTISSF